MDTDELFMFDSRDGYESRLRDILSQTEKLRNGKKSKAETRALLKLESAYEELVEEYLRFCGQEE